MSLVPTPVSLSEEQRQWVRDNIGLVGVHLRRYVANASRQRCDRERADLFQEGCLGLIRAAIEFRPQRGIPFAAFALPRIHYAVSQALWRMSGAPTPSPTARSTRVGGKKRRRRSNPNRDADVAIDPDGSPCPADPRTHPDAVPTAPETIGQRLRDKYERAVGSAALAAAARTSTRGDRAQLVRILTEERYLIPQEESRRPLRQIAKDTRSSYARVAECDAQLREAVREALDSDPEFRKLQRLARRNPHGIEAAVDDRVEQDLAQASADEFLRRFRGAGRASRSEMLRQVLDVSPEALAELVRRRFATLPPLAREHALRKG